MSINVFSYFFSCIKVLQTSQKQKYYRQELDSLYFCFSIVFYLIYGKCEYFVCQEITQTASAQEHAAHYLKLLTPVYINLVHVLLRKAQYPDDSVYKSMNGDEKEIFRCYRQDIADTIVSIYLSLVASYWSLSTMIQQLECMEWIWYDIFYCTDAFDMLKLCGYLSITIMWYSSAWVHNKVCVKILG